MEVTLDQVNFLAIGYLAVYEIRYSSTEPEEVSQLGN